MITSLTYHPSNLSTYIASGSPLNSSISHCFGVLATHVQLSLQIEEQSMWMFMSDATLFLGC